METIYQNKFRIRWIKHCHCEKNRKYINSTGERYENKTFPCKKCYIFSGIETINESFLLSSRRCTSI